MTQWLERDALPMSLPAVQFWTPLGGLGGLKETKLFLPHPRVKVSIVGSLRDREVACSASDRQGSNFESCVWRTVSSQSSHHPQEVLLAQFSLYVHKGGLKPDSFHFIWTPLGAGFSNKYIMFLPDIVSVLCPWERHSTLTYFTWLRCKWVPGTTEMGMCTIGLMRRNDCKTVCSPWSWNDTRTNRSSDQGVKY